MEEKWVCVQEWSCLPGWISVWCVRLISSATVWRAHRHTHTWTGRLVWPFNMQQATRHVSPSTNQMTETISQCSLTKQCVSTVILLIQSYHFSTETMQVPKLTSFHVGKNVIHTSSPFTLLISKAGITHIRNRNYKNVIDTKFLKQFKLDI